MLRYNITFWGGGLCRWLAGVTSPKATVILLVRYFFTVTLITVNF